MKKVEKMDSNDLMNWLVLACEAKGAKVVGRGTGDDQAEVDIDLEGRPYIVSIERLSKQQAEINRNPKEGKGYLAMPESMKEALNQANRKSELRIRAKYGDAEAERRGEQILATNESKSTTKQ